MSLEDYALRHLADCARSFGKLAPRRNPSGGYGRALSELVDSARVFAQQSDKQWATEVVKLREALQTYGEHKHNCRADPNDEFCTCGLDEMARE